MPVFVKLPESHELFLPPRHVQPIEHRLISLFCFEDRVKDSARSDLGFNCNWEPPHSALPPLRPPSISTFYSTLSLSLLSVLSPQPILCTLDKNFFSSGANYSDQNWNRNIFFIPSFGLLMMQGRNLLQIETLLPVFVSSVVTHDQSFNLQW